MELLIRLVIAMTSLLFVQWILLYMEIREPTSKVIFLLSILIAILFTLFGQSLVV